MNAHFLPDELSLQNYAVVRHSFEIVSVFRLPSVYFVIDYANQ